MKKKKKSKGIYFIIRGGVKVIGDPAKQPLEIMEEREYFGDMCLLSKHSHFDFVCKTAVVCLFIDETLLNQILIKNKKDLASAVATAKLRLKYHLLLKNNPDVLQKSSINFSGIQGEEDPEAPPSPSHPLETEEAQLIIFVTLFYLLNKSKFYFGPAYGGKF